MTEKREKFLLFRIFRFKDDKAFAELYYHHYPRVRRFVLYRVQQAHDADELTNEIFLKSWKYTQDTKVDNFTSLIFRISRNICIDYYRSKSRRKEVELEEAIYVASGENIEERVANEMSVEKIQQQLRRLKEDYRDLIIMRFFEQMSVKEIADAVDKSENAARVQLHRATKALKRIIEGKTN